MKQHSNISFMSFVSSSELNTPNKRKMSDDEEEDDFVDELGSAKFRPVKIPSEIYHKLGEIMPPNPLLPKTHLKSGDSPRFGGFQKFMKLVRFRGQDNGYSKFRQESAQIERIYFPEGTTLRKIFLPVINKDEQQALYPQPPKEEASPQKQENAPREPKKTPYGEIVYQRASENKDLKERPKFSYFEG